MKRPWLDILLDKIKELGEDPTTSETDENILCLHTQIKNYTDDEFGRFNGAYTFDSLCFFDLECTQENANKVIEKFCPIALGRDNHRLIKINGTTMLIHHDDERLNYPRVISFKYISNEQ